LDPASGLDLDVVVEKALRPPFTVYQQEVVRLDVTDDGRGAEGVVLLHAQVAGDDFPNDGRLFALTWTKVGSRWLMSSRDPVEPDLNLPPASAD
jgi:hypothetical protein